MTPVTSVRVAERAVDAVKPAPNAQVRPPRSGTRHRRAPDGPDYFEVTVVCPPTQLMLPPVNSLCLPPVMSVSSLVG